MAFGVGNQVTNVGLGIAAKRMFGSTPAQAEPKFVAFGVGATTAARTAAKADTALSSELAEGRATGTGSTVTTTQTNDTFQEVGLVTATGSRAVDEAGLFDAITTGNMFMSSTMNVVSLISGDTIQATMKVQFT